MNNQEDVLYAQLSNQINPDYKLLKAYLNVLLSHNREVPEELLLKLQAMEQLQQTPNHTIDPHMYNKLAAQHYINHDPAWAAFLTMNQIKDVLFIEQCNGEMSYEGAYELFCDEKPWEEKVKEFTILA